MLVAGAELRLTLAKMMYAGSGEVIFNSGVADSFMRPSTTLHYVALIDALRYGASTKCTPVYLSFIKTNSDYPSAQYLESCIDSD